MNAYFNSEAKQTFQALKSKKIIYLLQLFCTKLIWRWSASFLRFFFNRRIKVNWPLYKIITLYIGSQLIIIQLKLGGIYDKKKTISISWTAF